MAPLTGLAALKQFCASAHFSGLIYIQVSWNHRDKQGNYTVNPPTHWEKGENGELINYIYSGIVTPNNFLISRCSPLGKDEQGNTIWKPTGKQLNGFEYLKAQAEEGATIYFYPNQPNGGISNAHVGSSHLLFYEIDNLPLFEQWKRLNDLETLTGLKPCAIVFSGGKSLHVYFRLSQEIDAETHWRRLNRKLTVIQESDPAINNPARAMRLPGMVRRKAINGQLTESIDVSLEQWSDAVYTPEEFEKALDATGLFPYGLSYSRWLKWRWERLHGTIEKARAILNTPEEELTPKYDLPKLDGVNYNGEHIPLEWCLSRNDKALLASGVGEGSRDDSAYKLARNLIGTANELSRLGFNYSGDPYSLFDEFCSKCSPSLPERDRQRIWKSANRGNPSASLPTAIIEDIVSRYVAFKDRKPVTKRKLPGEISREEWENIKAVHSFREILNQILSKPKECLAIVPLKDGIAASGIIQYYPGELPEWDEYIALGCPLIEFQPVHQIEFLIEICLRNYLDTQIASMTGAGKSYSVGLLNRYTTGLGLSAELAVLATLISERITNKLLWELIRQIELPKDEGGRNWYFGQSPKNITTPTVRKNYERLIDRTAGDVMNYSKCDDEGTPYIRKAKKGETPDIPENCLFTNVFLAASEELDSFIPGGPDSPVCGRCPHLGKCPFLTTRQEQLKARNNMAAHPTQIGNIDVSRDRAFIDEPGKTVETEKLIKVSQRRIIETEIVVNHSEHPHKDAVARLLRIFAATLYETYHESNFPKYGLNAFETLEAIQKMLVKQGVNLPDFYDLREKIKETNWFKSLGSSANLAQVSSELAVKMWRKLQDLGDYLPHPTISVIEQLINEHIAGGYDDNFDVWEIPTIKDLVKQFNEIVRNHWDKILEGKQTPEAQEKAVREQGRLNSIKNLIPVLYDPFTSISINKDGCFEVIRKNWKIVKNFQKYRSRTYLDATTPPYVLKRKFGIKHLAVARQAVASDLCSKLTIEIIDGAGSFGRVPEGGTLPETTHQRWNELAKYLAYEQLDIGCSKVALFGYKGQEGLYSEVLPLIAGTGAMFSDTTGNNRYQDFDCIIAAAEPRENIRQKESEFQALFGVFPSGRNRAWFQSWYRQRVTEEIIQMSGRLRPSRTDAPKTVYLLAGDCLTAANVAQIAAAFPGCTINRTNVIDICPSAAMKGERRKLEFYTFSWELALGGELDLKALAQRLNVHESRVSQIAQEVTGASFRRFKKTLVLLLDAINNKTKVWSELSDDEKYIAQTLMDVGSQLELGVCDESTAVEHIDILVEAFGRSLVYAALRAVPNQTLSVLIGKIFTKMAQITWEKIPIEPPEPIPLSV